MALHELTAEETRTWTRAEKDHWWLTNVYRGNLPQLTWRSATTGFLLGGVLSATNLYIGAKSGTTLGVGLTSVILAFALFKLLSRAGAGRDFTILENNAMQSIATAAGYMTSPLISSLAALMLMTNTVIPWWQMILWNVVISIIGVLVAFPLKRRFINEDQLPFPEGRACGVVLDTLYTDKGGDGLFKARVLAIAAAIAASWQFLIS
ncbi:MAG: OPT/YSL family transporter, partial [Puniceicoccales bacterium]|nr:OPT/YSL family transporter [Puniceicoccales bacterium]